MKKIYDVVVIGGGPAGMMAAGRAAELGASVVVLEKNATLGKKLLITGGGRCNVTNAQTNVRAFLSKYKESDRFLFSAFSQFSVTDTLNFFHLRKLPTKVEAESRVFPITDSAKSVWTTLLEYMKKGGVEVKTSAAVAGIKVDQAARIVTVELAGKKFVQAKTCIVAAGGASRPETGSSGDAFGWLAALGHTIIPTSFALVPVALRDTWIKKVQGVTLQDIKLTVFQNGQKQESRKGKLLFTHFGISGPTVLNLSKDIGELLKYGEVGIELDVLPGRDHGDIKKQLQDLLIAQSNKKCQNVVGAVFPKALVPVLLELSNIDGDTPCHSITREEKSRLVAIAKALPLQVKGLLGADKAVVSSGGVKLSEVNFKTMESRVASYVYIIGDVLNIDRPSGGYSLQLCWTTGFVAGTSAATAATQTE